MNPEIKTQPFTGVFMTPDRTLFDIASGQEVIPANLPEHLQPFIGIFYDAEGNEHDLRDFVGGGGRGGTTLWFATIADRDAFYTENPEQLKEGISVGVGDPVVAWTYTPAGWIQGALAFKGDQGEPGHDGITPHIGTNNNWWIGTTDTEVSALGSDGAPGITPHIGTNNNWWIGTTDTGVSALGSDGTPGLTPNIGHNGNWWIGSTDTGVSATGPKGEDGQGIQISGNVANYAMLMELATTLSQDDVGKGWLNDSDGLLYIWSGTSFPAEGYGVEFRGPKGDPGDSHIPIPPPTGTYYGLSVDGVAKWLPESELIIDGGGP